VHKFGRNVDVDTAADEDVWDGGGDYNWPTAAQTHNIVSDDTDDDGDPAGTGARTIRIYGLDSSYDEITEDVTLNGTTNVTTSNSYLRIHRMKVLTAGSQAENDGNITATGTSDATITAQITAEMNQTLMAIYTVPNGYTAYMIGFYAAVEKSIAISADIYLLERPTGEVFQVKHVTALKNDGQTRGQHLYPLPRVIQEKTDIKIRAGSSANDGDVTAGFDLLLIDEP